MIFDQKPLFPSVFDGQDQRLDKLGDPLAALDGVVNWEALRPLLRSVHHKAERKSRAGRKPLDPVMMFKALVLQSFYNLSDEQMEYQIEDRRSFRRFLGLREEDTRAPDRNTIRMFREKLGARELDRKLFAAFDQQLEAAGFIARKGQMIDASIVRAPVQRNGRNENEKIKLGEVPDDWKPAKREQKGTDARWTKKHGKSYYGYKNLVNVDHDCKLIRSHSVSDASVHDSNEFEGLLDPSNTSKAVWADSAYRSRDHERMLADKGYHSQVHRKGRRNKPLTEREQRSNRTKPPRSRTRRAHLRVPAVRTRRQADPDDRHQAGVGQDRDDEPGLQHAPVRVSASGAGLLRSDRCVRNS